MYKGLIDYLTYTYTFIAKGRAALREDDVRALQAGAATIVRSAPAVITDASRAESDEDRRDMREAVMIRGHIDEMVTLLINQEVC